MGFWLGTLIFIAFELIGWFFVKTVVGTRRGRRHELLGQVLVAASVVCCWLIWVIVYMGQMKVRVCATRLSAASTGRLLSRLSLTHSQTTQPLVNPVLPS